MPVNFTLTKVAGREYQLDIPGPGKGDVVISVRELSRGITPPVFNDLETIEVPILSIPYVGTIKFPTDNVYQVDTTIH